MRMAITVAIPNSSLLPAAVSKPPVSPASMCTAISRKKSLRRLKSSATAKVNACLDSMRASSPTRKSAPTLSETEDHINSWILNHPSPLNKLDEIINIALEGKKIVMFLDYDGTLSPIVEDPDRAFMTDEMREAVRAVAEFFPTAIVSGRCISKVHSFIKLSELYYAGSHGMDIKGPTEGRNYKKGNEAVLCQPAREFLPMIDEVYKSLSEKTKSIPGAKVENNKFCLSVHYRCVDEKMWADVAELVESVLKEYPKLKMTRGRKVLEIRPSINWDKGKALEFLLEALGYANATDVLPVYIGDDQTDEDAFKVLSDKGQGFGVLVSKNPRSTHATYSLQDPTEVMYFLQRLVQWKRSSQ